MSNEKNTYPNAGAQTKQAWSEMRNYGALSDDALITLKTVAIVLGINRNKVSRIPVKPVMVEKRKCYRKGDVASWVAEDSSQPESLLARLRAEHSKARDRIAKEPSRLYVSGQLGKAEAKQAKAKTKVNVGSPFSVDEKAAGWDKRMARQQLGSPIWPLSMDDADR